ncbi:hypothetical protein PRZ48_008239 [Zasmidium cellare]|uniref:Uncharacterized protein n=1 Tax=Zasmidium cellare TaxID=395010 RepID=A0ABR0EG14_ZASCE|nr:hypothetical protein PRZ48_008239 [Zasmidium cellare]
MHWLHTRNPDLSPELTPPIETKGRLTLTILIFHQNKILLLHNAQENKWVLPHSAPLPNSRPSTFQALYDSTSTSGKTLQDIAMKSLEHGFRDSVLDNLQFHDLVLNEALTVSKQEDDGEELVLVTSISAVLPHKLQRNEKGLFTFHPLSEPQCDDLRLCSMQEAKALVREETSRLMEQAWNRYLTASNKALVLRFGLQPWIQNVLTAYIHCQLLRRGERYFDQLPKDWRKDPVDEVMRDYKMAICSKILPNGEEELIVCPLTPEESGGFSEQVGLWEMRWVGSHILDNGIDGFEG